MNDYLLELRHLKKYYGRIRGIEDVSIKLKKGEIYGFIGPNGAGKSTTLRTIMGLINPNDPDTKKLIGYLPSEVHLYEDMTVKEILDYHESFYKMDTSKRRKELVSLLKVNEKMKIEDLSLGNLKKVGII